MKKNLNIKIFNNNLNNNSKTIALRKKIGDIGKTKYLPSFSKEWKNTIYSYNKNILKNIPANDVNINKIIQSYFNLYFKDHKYVGSKKFILLRRRRTFLRKIYVSNAEIKHTNNKAIITLFTVNREKKILKKRSFEECSAWPRALFSCQSLEHWCWYNLLPCATLWGQALSGSRICVSFALCIHRGLCRHCWEQ